jgi:Fuc2NAc and GlcNAc transferase
MRRWAIRKNLLDIPNVRSSHGVPTPRGGGVAIVSGFLLAIVALCSLGTLDNTLAIAVFCGGLAIAAVGFIDDRWQLPATLRLVVHFGAAIFVVTYLGPPHTWFLGGWIGVTFTVIGVVWVTNLFNFMDGIDGIAGSEATFVATAGALLNWLDGGDASVTVAMLSISAASLGFLVWNWPPARIFMGDVGSGFLGFELATLGLCASERTSLPFEVWLILAGVFIIDSSMTLFWRLISGARWMNAHRTHAYQHLALRFGSHKKVTIFVIVIDVFWLLPWAFFANRFPIHAVTCLVSALTPLAILAWRAGAGRSQ